MDSKISFSLVIPVLHEENGINPLIDSLHAQFPGESFEIIVVDGDSEGSTIQGIQAPQIVATTSPPGRGTQMNAGARLACGVIGISKLY